MSFSCLTLKRWLGFVWSEQYQAHKAAGNDLVTGTDRYCFYIVGYNRLITSLVMDKLKQYYTSL